MSRQCSRCTAVLPEDDNFCEECGASLNAPPPAASFDPPGCCPKCHAGRDEIDDEGFCAACGFRREERGRDHFEFTISPQLAGVTDRGLRHHRNEDYLALKSFENASILIVCDGVSSVRDPDLASAAAAERTMLSFEEMLLAGRVIGETEMQEALAFAHASVSAIPLANGGSSDVTDADRPATTIVAAVAQADCITLGWLGDSRAYWIDGDGARQLTIDHSWLHDAVCSGEVSEAEAQRSPHAHAITRWLGADAGGDFQASVTQFEIPGPGKLLLCTDGLWNYASDPSLLAGLVTSLDGDVSGISRALIGFARSKGGNDNITAAVLSLAGAHETG